MCTEHVLEYLTEHKYLKEFEARLSTQHFRTILTDPLGQLQHVSPNVQRCGSIDSIRSERTNSL